MKVPDGDLLIHAGDLTARGTMAEWWAACEWLASQPHRDKVLVAELAGKLREAGQ